jgi:hypothetical protein
MQIFKVGPGPPQHRQKALRHPEAVSAPLVVALLLPKAYESRVPLPAPVQARPCVLTRLLHRFPPQTPPARIRTMANQRNKRRPMRHTFPHWDRSMPHDLTTYHRLWADATKDSAVRPTRLLILSIRLTVSHHALPPRCQSCRKIRWRVFRKDGHSFRPRWWVHLVLFRKTSSSLASSVSQTPRSKRRCVVTLVRQVAAQGR